MNLLIAISLNFLPLQSLSEPLNDSIKYFEGSIQFETFDSKTEKIILTQEFLVKEGLYRVKAIEQTAKFELGDIIYNTSKFVRINIKSKNKIVEYLNIEPDLASERPRVEVSDEYLKILEFTCRKYIIKKYSQYWGKDLTSHHWVAEELKFKNLDIIAFLTGHGNTFSNTFRFSEGVSLMIEHLDDQGRKSFITKAINIDFKYIELAEFKIPSEEDGFRVIGQKN